MVFYRKQIIQAAKVRFFSEMTKFICIFIQKIVPLQRKIGISMENFFASFDIWQVLSAFILLIAIIDPFGNIPITIDMQQRGRKINAYKVCIASVTILIVFLLLGEWILKIFGVPIEYFAIAGGFIIFLMALEMVLDIEIFKNNIEGEGSIVPLAFPMYAGPGAFTAVLSLTAEYSTINLILAIFFSIAVLFFVLVGTNWLTKFMGQTALYIVRKFFGIIVLAIACKLMFGNLALIF